MSDTANETKADDGDKNPVKRDPKFKPGNQVGKEHRFQPGNQAAKGKKGKRAKTLTAAVQQRMDDRAVDKLAARLVAIGNGEDGATAGESLKSVSMLWDRLEGAITRKLEIQQFTQKRIVLDMGVCSACGHVEGDDVLPRTVEAEPVAVGELRGADASLAVREATGTGIAERVGVVEAGAAPPIEPVQPLIPRPMTAGPTRRKPVVFEDVLPIEALEDAAREGSHPLPLPGGQPRREPRE